MTQSKANPQENLFWWKTVLWRLFVSTNHQLKGRKLKKQKKTAKLSTPALLHISGTTALKKTMLCFCWKLDIRNEVIKYLFVSRKTSTFERTFKHKLEMMKSNHEQQKKHTSTHSAILLTTRRCFHNIAIKLIKINPWFHQFLKPKKDS